jgi:hypothetical protein
MARNPQDEVDLREVLFEMHRVGNSVRVAAIDPITNTEVIVIGAPYMSKYSLKIKSMRKLKYVIAKKRAENRC